MTALMGPSGSGKTVGPRSRMTVIALAATSFSLVGHILRSEGFSLTLQTLLDVLAGRKTAGSTSGTILFGNTKPSPGFLARHTGYGMCVPRCIVSKQQLSSLCTRWPVTLCSRTGSKGMT
jgi:hypothetical protein